MIKRIDKNIQIIFDYFCVSYSWIIESKGRCLSKSSSHTSMIFFILYMKQKIQYKMHQKWSSLLNIKQATQVYTEDHIFDSKLILKIKNCFENQEFLIFSKVKQLLKLFCLIINSLKIND